MHIVQTIGIWVSFVRRYAFFGQSYSHTRHSLSIFLISFPKQYFPILPPRQAYSHWASVGSFNPVISQNSLTIFPGNFFYRPSFSLKCRGVLSHNFHPNFLSYFCFGDQVGQITLLLCSGFSSREPCSLPMPKFSTWNQYKFHSCFFMPIFLYCFCYLSTRVGFFPQVYKSIVTFTL